MRTESAGTPTAGRHATAAGELAQALRLARQSATGQGTAERTALAQPRHSEVAARIPSQPSRRPVGS